MRIAIIGAGNVGGGLGKAFTTVGHDVVFGVRDPESTKTQAALAEIDVAEATSMEQAVEGADAIVIAVRPVAMNATAAAIGPLDGRIVIDAMNRFDGDPSRSTADDLAALMPGAKLVKAFNTTGYENLTTAGDRGVRAAMFVAGDDPGAKGVALDLAAAIGFDAVDAGGLGNARILEDMVRVWLVIAQARGRNVAFALSEG